MPLRALLIDDSELDAELIVRELRRAGYDVSAERVASAPALTAALRRSFDVIICDWKIPGFGALEALRLIVESGSDVPTIIVSADVDEEYAVTAMKSGAQDVVSKHRLARLGPAVERELRAVEDRRARRQAEAAHTVETPVLDGAGQLHGVLGVSRDMTAMHAAEETLRANEIRYRDLEAFRYSVSHDLRAPLRIVEGFSRAVLEDYAGLLPVEGRRQLEAIRRGAVHMTGLIDALLELSRLGRAPLRARPVEMSALVHQALDALDGPRAGRDLSIRVGDLPVCEGDPTLLKQVWRNLLDNAIKFTAGRNPAAIEIGARDDGREPIYFVRDNGAGFDMAHAKRLFQVFQRMHGESEFAGIGVGLAIVHQIVQRHGGRVWAEAAVDRGATFFFTLGQAGPGTDADSQIAELAHDTPRSRR